MPNKKMPPNHVHSYARMRNKFYYRCTHPDCTHTNSRDVLEGKRAVCESCGDQFFLDRIQLRNKIPHCAACTRSPKAIEIRKRKEQISEGFNAMDIDTLFTNEDISDNYDAQERIMR